MDPDRMGYLHLTTVNAMRTSTVSKSALAISDEHRDLADAVIGQLGD